MQKSLTAIQKLDGVGLLNGVGIALARYPERYPKTLRNIGEFFDGDSLEFIIQQISRSSLTGPSDEDAIQEWIAVEEIEKGEKNMECLDCNYYLNEKLGCFVKSATMDNSKCFKR